VHHVSCFLKVLACLYACVFFYLLACRPALSLEALIQLARSRRFGRSAHNAGPQCDEEGSVKHQHQGDQVFLVVADSVMKQLDGLKVGVFGRVACAAFMWLAA
jgi:hypothetical protein